MSCANIVPPSGGPIDKTPPTLVDIYPKDSSLLIKPKEINLIFDKYMVLGDVTSQLSISPNIKITPTVQAKLRKVTISIVDSLLEENTTYTISLGNALKDNREGTPFENFTYTFSTGAYLDTLQISGFAFNAETRQVDTGMIAALYERKNFSDSNIYNKKPLYQTMIKEDGKFQFKNLPNKEFHLFIIKDRNRDKLYSPGIEEIAFSQYPITPSYLIDTTYHFTYFLEELDSLTLQQSLESSNITKAESIGIRNKKTNQSLPTLSADEIYKVWVDTFTQNKGSMDLSEPIKISIKSDFKDIDSEKIFLSVEKDEVEIEVPYQLEKVDSNILLNIKWFEDSKYTLRLVKGWLGDSTGNEAPPSKYQFITKKESEYGKMTLLFPDSLVNNNYLFEILKDTELYKEAQLINDSIFKFDLLPSGNYWIKIIQDNNKDGKWTTGNYLNKIYPENIFIHPSPVIIKNGWEMETKIEPTDKPIKMSTSMRSGANKPSM